MRRFYQIFPIRDALRRELSWTHYRLLMRIHNEQARDFYLKEAIDGHWSTRTLERQISSFYYERLLASQNRKPVITEAESKAQPIHLLKIPRTLETLT